MLKYIVARPNIQWDLIRCTPQSLIFVYTEKKTTLFWFSYRR